MKTNKIIEEFKKDRTEAVSEMFDNGYGDGLYPTSQLYKRLDDALRRALSTQREGFKSKVLKEIGAHESPHTDSNCTSCRVEKLFNK